MRKNILITGASSGLGAEMARQFAAKGHNLALTARRTEKLDALAAELSDTGVEIVVHQLDVNDHAQVFSVFEQSIKDLGGLDRVIVNAGLGKGARIGTGRFDANRETIETNFVAALAQCEAAMAHFYERNAGHLVLISSFSAKRGMPGAINAYAATKIALAHLGEGIRMDQVGRTNDIKVTTLFPGYIASEMNEKVAQQVHFMVDTETGVRAMVEAIDKEVEQASVPTWPWKVLAPVVQVGPRTVVRKLF